MKSVARIALDVVLDRGPNSAAISAASSQHVASPDVALVGARMHGDAVRAGADHQARGLEHARIAHVALIAQQRHLVEVDAELDRHRLHHDRGGPLVATPGTLKIGELDWTKEPI